MSVKSLAGKYLYVIHVRPFPFFFFLFFRGVALTGCFHLVQANNSVSKIPYFTEHSSFVRFLIKQRREDVVKDDRAAEKAQLKQTPPGQLHGQVEQTLASNKE